MSLSAEFMTGTENLYKTKLIYLKLISYYQKYTPYVQIWQKWAPISDRENNWQISDVLFSVPWETDLETDINMQEVCWKVLLILIYVGE